MLNAKKMDADARIFMVTGILVALFLSVWPDTAMSQNGAAAATKAFTLYWENDSFTGSDKDYSNGLKLTWSRLYSPPENQERGVKDWMISHLPLMNNAEARRATSFSIGQNIFTPEDTDRSDVIVDDRPYAGYTYLGFGFVSISICLPLQRQGWS